MIETVPSWYSPKLELDEKQEGYVKLVTKLFNMKSEMGKPVPYKPTAYQVEFHSESLNVKKQYAQDILFVKARGVSFTMCSCIELIMSAHKYKDTTFPVIAQRFDSAKGIVRVAQWLIKNSNVIKEGNTEIDLRDGIEMQETEIRFPNGSTIKPYPSGTASDAVRSLRLVRALMDEFAYQSRDEELLAAVQDTMIGEHSQIMIGSTPCGINNKFYDLVQKPVGFKLFNLPAFDDTKFDINKSLFEQDLISVAPWLDIGNLETKRRRDEHIFMQEHMCSFMDDSVSYLSFGLIRSVEDTGLDNYLHVVEKEPEFIYDSENPMYMGIDVARNRDFTAITIFEKSTDETGKDILTQRYLGYIKDKTLPAQEEYLDRLLSSFPQVIKCRIDATGLGLGLFEYLRRRKGGMIEGIHFAEKVATGTRTKASVVERMSVNLKTLMQDQKISLIVDDTQEKHLNDVDYDFKAIRRPGLGHGDMFYAIALAVLPENFRAAQTGYFQATRGAPILSEDTTKTRVGTAKKATELSWDDKLKGMKKTGSMIR